MNIIKGVFILVGLISISCSRKYGCDDLEFKNGLTYEINSGDPASGKLKCKEDRDGHGYLHESYFEYSKGRQVGSWKYLAQGDIIHHGKILDNDKLQQTLSERFKADYIELDLWWEGNKNYLELNVINAKKDLDSVKIQRLVNTELKVLLKENNLDRVTVQILRNWTWNNSVYILTFVDGNSDSIK